MKTLIEAPGWQDFIITHTTNVVKASNGKDIKFIDEENKWAEYRGSVTEVVFYEDEYVEGCKTGNAKRINLKVEAILRLADKIRQINSTTTNELYIPDDNLPW